MGAGVYIVRFKRSLQCRVGRSLKARTSLRVETGACFLALEHAKDIRAPIIILTDSANHLSEIDDWVGPGPDGVLLQGWRYSARSDRPSALPDQPRLSYLLCESARTQR